MRESDPRIGGRFWSVDPLSKKYPGLSPYQFASNNPIWALDQDGKEAWLYYDNLQGWKQSTVFGGPFTEAEANKVGYYSAAQVHKFQEEVEQDQNKRAREQQYEDAAKGAYEVAKTQNLFGLLYQISPVKGLYDAGETADEGHPVMASVMAGLAVSDFGELFNATGKSFAGIAQRLADKYTIEQTWKLHPLVRGILTEARLSSSVYKGFEWLGQTAGPFFKGFDFYKASEGLAVSLKTVNADKNFDFKNIIENINQLAELKKAGATAQYGRQFIVKDVRLDIAIPKGYDESVLGGVKQAAEAAKVPINIFEH
jgi:hypothetical protein